VGRYKDERMFKALREAMEQIGVAVIKPEVVAAKH